MVLWAMSPSPHFRGLIFFYMGSIFYEPYDPRKMMNSNNLHHVPIYGKKGTNIMKKLKEYAATNSSKLISDIVCADLGINWTNLHDTNLLKFQHYEKDRGFTGFDDKVELVGYDQDAMGGMHYLVITNGHIEQIGMTDEDFVKVADFLMSIKRELELDDLLK